KSPLTTSCRAIVMTAATRYASLGSCACVLTSRWRKSTLLIAWPKFSTHNWPPEPLFMSAALFLATAFRPPPHFLIVRQLKHSSRPLGYEPKAHSQLDH